ncbi:MAG: septum formation initiator family protein [Oscillospiraceae bacterium]|nr:septum formation initiator family protein [Oscillospiraceae bacterium]
MQVKKAGLLTKIVVLALLIYLATALLDLRGQLQDARTEQDILSAQVAQTQQEIAEKQYVLENKDDPDVLEQVARDKGFVKPGEKLFVDVTN